MLRRRWILPFAIALASCSKKYQEHHPNGTLSLECEHNSGGCDGAYQRFDLNGHMTECGYLSKGKPHGNRVGFFANGDTEYVAVYRDGLLDGTMKDFYPGNIKKNIGYYKGGKQVGKVLTYYPNGRLQAEAEVPMDNVTTRLTEYDESGNVRFRALIRGRTTVYYEHLDSLGVIVERFPNIPTPPASADVRSAGSDL